jgi:predicted acetyltransferase
VRASIEAGAIVGAFDGSRLVGSARFFLMEQWWHGRSMPMAGVAGVKVAPEERGRGVATAMMAALLEQIGERGFPVSVLFPTTSPLYRGAGWEIAGGRYETVLPARSLVALASPDWPATSGTGPAPEEPLNLRRATPADAAAIAEIESQVHERLRVCGPNTREVWMLRDWLDDVDCFAYMADDGFLSYRWVDGTHELEVDELVAGSAGTARAFWQILASHATTASRITACLAPDDPVMWLTRDPAAETRLAHTWMLRVVDAPAAVAARGYPAGAVVSVRLDITDAARPANSGHWALEVSGGMGSLTRLADGPGAAAFSIGARGFAALFAGVPVRSLRLAGLVAGGDAAADDVLSSAFGGPAYMIDRF